MDTKTAVKAWIDSLPEARRRSAQLVATLRGMAPDYGGTPERGIAQRAVELFELFDPEDPDEFWGDTWRYAELFDDLEDALPWLTAGWFPDAAAECKRAGIDTPDRAEGVLAERGLTRKDLSLWNVWGPGGYGFPWEDNEWTPEAESLMNAIRRERA